MREASASPKPDVAIYQFHAASYCRRLTEIIDYQKDIVVIVQRWILSRRPVRVQRACRERSRSAKL